MKIVAIVVVIISIILIATTIGTRKLNFFESGDQEELLEAEVSRDFKNIQNEGTLRAITTYSSTNYFVYKGEPMGYEYELLQNLTQYLDLNLQMIVAKGHTDAFRLLREGQGDVVAMGLTVNASNKEKAAFTDPLKTTKYSLVQKKPSNWRNLKKHEIEDYLIRDPFELGDEPIYVQEQSPHFKRLQNIEEETGQDLNIITIPGHLTPYEILSKVNNEEYEYAVIDKNDAKINKADFPDIDVDTDLSLPVRVAWAVRESSPALKEKINAWLGEEKNSLEYNVIYNKYFKNRRFFQRRIDSEFYSKNSGQISPYDSLIKMYSGNFDWRFIASLIYQESQFRTDTSSWVGAQGLMQLMPATAKQYGVSNILDPAENIEAGVKHFKHLMSEWKTIPDSTQRLKFALASYNAGFGHVEDARNLAKKYDADPEMWDGNVEEYVKKLSNPEFFTDPVVKYGYCRGQEPFTYVKNIFKRFKHYQKFIPTKEEVVYTTNVEPYEPVKVF